MINLWTLVLGFITGSVMVISMQIVTLWFVSRFYFAKDITSTDEGMDIKSLTEDAKSDTTAERFDLQALWTRVQDEKDTTATLGAPEASALGEMIGQRLIQHLALNLTFKEVAAEYVREKIRNSDIFGLKVVTDVAVLSGDMELDRLKLFNIQIINHNDPNNLCIAFSLQSEGIATGALQLTTMVGVQLNCELKLESFGARILVNLGRDVGALTILSPPELKVGVYATLDNIQVARLPAFLHGGLCWALNEKMVYPNQYQIALPATPISEAIFKRHNFELVVPEVGAKYAQVTEAAHTFDKHSGSIKSPYCEVCGGSVKTTPVMCSVCALVVHSKCVDGKRTVQCLDVVMQRERLNARAHGRRMKSMRHLINTREKAGSASLTYANMTGTKLATPYSVGLVKLILTLKSVRSGPEVGGEEKNKSRSWYCITAMGTTIHRTQRRSFEDSCVNFVEEIEFHYRTDELPQVVRLSLFEHDSFGKDQFMGAVFVDVTGLHYSTQQYSSFEARGSLTTSRVASLHELPTVDLGFFATLTPDDPMEVQDEVDEDEMSAIQPMAVPSLLPTATPKITTTTPRSLPDAHASDRLKPEDNGTNTDTSNGINNGIDYGTATSKESRLKTEALRVMRKARSFTPATGTNILRSKRPGFVPADEKGTEIAPKSSSRVFANARDIPFKDFDPVLFEAICYSVDNFSGLHRRLYRLVHYFLKPAFGANQMKDSNNRALAANQNPESKKKSLKHTLSKRGAPAKKDEKANGTEKRAVPMEGSSDAEAKATATTSSGTEDTSPQDDGGEKGKFKDTTSLSENKSTSQPHSTMDAPVHRNVVSPEPTVKRGFKVPLRNLDLIVKRMGDITNCYLRGLFSIGLVHNPSDKKHVYDQTFISALRLYEFYVKAVTQYAHVAVDTFTVVTEALHDEEIDRMYVNARTASAVRVQNAEMAIALPHTPIMQIHQPTHTTHTTRVGTDEEKSRGRDKTPPITPYTPSGDGDKAGTHTQYEDALAFADIHTHTHTHTQCDSSRPASQGTQKGHRQTDERLSLDTLFECVVQCRDLLSNARIWASMDTKGMTFTKSMNPMMEALNKYVETHANTLNSIYEQRARRSLPCLPTPYPPNPATKPDLPYRLIESYNVHFPDRSDVGTLWLFNRFFCVTAHKPSQVPGTQLSYLIEPRQYNVSLTQRAVPGIFFDSDFHLMVTDKVSRAHIATFLFVSDVKASLCCGLFATCIADNKAVDPRKKKKEGALSDFIAEHLGIGNTSHSKAIEPQVHFALMTLRPSPVNGVPQPITNGKTSVVMCKDGSGLDLNYRATSKLVKRQKYIAFESVRRMERDMKNDNSITVTYVDGGDQEMLTLSYADKIADKAMAELETAYAAAESVSRGPSANNNNARESKSSTLGGAMKATAPRLARFVQAHVQSARGSTAAAVNEGRASDVSANRETDRNMTPSPSGTPHIIDENEEYDDALDRSTSARQH